MISESVSISSKRRKVIPDILVKNAELIYKGMCFWELKMVEEIIGAIVEGLGPADIPIDPRTPGWKIILGFIIFFFIITFLIFIFSTLN